MAAFRGMTIRSERILSSPSMFQLVGDEKLRRGLKALRGAAQRKIMRPAINAGLTPILQQARADAPGNTIPRLLKKRVKNGKRGNVIGQVYVKESPRKVRFRGREIGFEFVASVLEFGSPRQGIRARRYLRGARDKRGQEALQALTQKAEERLKLEWEKGTL